MNLPNLLPSKALDRTSPRTGCGSEPWPSANLIGFLFCLLRSFCQSHRVFVWLNYAAYAVLLTVQSRLIDIWDENNLSYFLNWFWRNRLTADYFSLQNHWLLVTINGGRLTRLGRPKTQMNLALSAGTGGFKFLPINLDRGKQKTTTLGLKSCRTYCGHHKLG